MENSGLNNLIEKMKNKDEVREKVSVGVFLKGKAVWSMLDT